MWFHRLASIHDYKFSQFQPSNSFIKIFIANVSTTVLWSSSGHIKYRLGIHYKYRKLYANDQK